MTGFTLAVILLVNVLMFLLGVIVGHFDHKYKCANELANQAQEFLDAVHAANDVSTHAYMIRSPDKFVYAQTLLVDKCRTITAKYLDKLV